MTYENELYHTIAVLIVPVVLKLGILIEHLAAHMSGSRGEPLTVVGAVHLLARLLEHDSPILVLFDPEQTLGADDVLGEGSEELLELILCERLTAIVYKCTYAVLFYLAALVMMVVVMVMSVLVLIVIMVMMMLVVVFIMVVMMLMVVIVIVVVMVVMVIVMVIVVVVVIVVIVIVHIGVELLYPSGGVSYLIKIKVVSVEYLFEINLAADSLNDLSLGLESADDLFYINKLFIGNEIDLVEDDGVAELDLLDKQILDILVVDIIL